MSVQAFFHRRRHQKACQGKQKHNSYGAAQAAVRSVQQRLGDELNAYHCRYCGGWHTGHKKASKAAS